MLEEIFTKDVEKLATVLALSIPIVAIIAGCTTAIIKMFITHRERVKMIEQGIHPDYPPEDEEPMMDN